MVIKIQLLPYQGMYVMPVCLTQSWEHCICYYWTYWYFLAFVGWCLISLFFHSVLADAVRVGISRLGGHHVFTRPWFKLRRFIFTINYSTNWYVLIWPLYSESYFYHVIQISNILGSPAILSIITFDPSGLISIFYINQNKIHRFFPTQVLNKATQ